MTKDFSKYQNIIDDFSGQVLSNDFESRFTSKTKGIAKTERFLLKMELKRLANPCTRLIDLRGHVDGECRAYEHEERIHYLDEVAIKVFEDAIANYQGYSFGVYEAVMNTENNFRVIYQKEKKKTLVPETKGVPAKALGKTQYPAQLFSFGPYYNRNEERMNFAITIHVHLDDDTSKDATSSDISVNGCKFRFNQIENIKVKQLITISFTGLESEFQFGKDVILTYEVQNIQVIDNIQLVGVSRIYLPDAPEDGFRKFLNGFIQGNKRRYKINLDNSISALQSRSFEQFVLPKSNELAIFISDEDGESTPKFALTCHNNQNIYQYWQDEERKSTLHNLVTPVRFLRLKKLTKLGKTLLVFSFFHTNNGKTYFYTADTEQLQEDKLFMTQFIGFAASKKSFAITQLSYIEVDGSLAESHFTLANSLTSKDKHLNQPVTTDVKDSLSSLNGVVIANNIISKDIFSYYQNLSFESINTSKLKKFGHKRSSQELFVDEVGINYKNHRQEPRFKYVTPIVASLAGDSWKGASHDFSTSGLKIELIKAATLKKGDIINVAFPMLQKITSSFELNELPYEVMRVNSSKKLINLRVFVEQHQHIGRAFFKALIQKNQNKLTPDEYAMLSPDLAKALRNIYSSSLKTLTLMIQTSGSRYKVESITSNDKNSKILSFCRQLSDRNHHYNLYPLLNNLQARGLMNSTIKKMNSKDAPIVDILYVAINLENEMVDKSVTTKLEAELPTDALKNDFIKKALTRGDFFCMQVLVSRTEAPDMEHLNPELSYISSYAIHRGKQLEQEIWSVAGLVQVFDITSEAMIRYQLSQV